MDMSLKFKKENTYRLRWTLWVLCINMHRTVRITIAVRAQPSLKLMSLYRE